MSTTQRIDDLIALLIKGTGDGSLRWQVTADEDTFRLASPSANLRITRSEQFDPESEESYVTRRLSVLNDKGMVIEEYSPEAVAAERQAALDAKGAFQMGSPGREETGKFDSLYANARRSAYNTDEVLDKLMKELRQSVSVSK